MPATNQDNNPDKANLNRLADSQALSRVARDPNRRLASKAKVGNQEAKDRASLSLNSHRTANRLNQVNKAADRNQVVLPAVASAAALQVVSAVVPRISRPLSTNFSENFRTTLVGNPPLLDAVSAIGIKGSARSRSSWSSQTFDSGYPKLAKRQNDFELNLSATDPCLNGESLTRES